MFDDTLQREEEQEVFNRLVELTERGKIHWECEEYIPISFMDKDTLDGQPAYLSQMFTLTLQVQDVSYELEMDEYLTISEGKRDIALKLTRPMTEDYMQLETALSYDSSYDSYAPDQLGEFYKDSPIMRIAAAIVQDMASREEILETFEWARYVNQSRISKGLLNHPLTKLGEKLFNERRVLDFHRIVFDIPYRKSLMEK